MSTYFEALIIIPILLICHQFYSFSVSKRGVEQQRSSQILGIVYMTIGITALAIRSIPFAVGGLILIMLGFRLLAKGLDRLDKKVFIDRYKDDDL